MPLSPSRRGHRTALAVGAVVLAGFVGAGLVGANGADRAGTGNRLAAAEPIPVLRTDAPTVQLQPVAVTEQLDDAQDRIESLDSELNQLRATAVVLYEAEADLQVQANATDARVETAGASAEAARATPESATTEDDAASPPSTELVAALEERREIETATDDVLARRAAVAVRIAEIKDRDRPDAEEVLETAEEDVEDVAAISDELVLPVIAVESYVRAEEILAAAAPGCGLRWWMLAAVGRIESGHGTSGGAAPDDFGNLSPRILGPRLDGVEFAAIADSDGGLFDGDPAWDHAVGPMQFLPTTWHTYAEDGNGDGEASPHNFYDAAAAAGWYLCNAGSPLDSDDALFTAFRAYNHSDAYAAQVLAYARLYESAGLPAY